MLPSVFRLSFPCKPLQVQQLELLRRLITQEGNSDATEWLLERVMEHSKGVVDHAAISAPTEAEILSELSPLHLEHLLTESERDQFETQGVRGQHAIHSVQIVFLRCTL